MDSDEEIEEEHDGQHPEPLHEIHKAVAAAHKRPEFLELCEAGLANRPIMVAA